jgi:hypothetical protein
MLVAAGAAQADLTWPARQLLPSFPAPKPIQDLITLRETPLHWEAEGPLISHGTGRLDGDGWLCQTGIDTPNAHMAVDHVRIRRARTRPSSRSRSTTTRPTTTRRS